MSILKAIDDWFEAKGPEKSSPEPVDTVGATVARPAAVEATQKQLVRPWWHDLAIGVLFISAFLTGFCMARPGGSEIEIMICFGTALLAAGALNKRVYKTDM